MSKIDNPPNKLVSAALGVVTVVGLVIALPGLALIWGSQYFDTPPTDEGDYLS